MDLARCVLNDGHEKWVAKHTAAWRPGRLPFALVLAIAQAACGSSSSGDATAAAGTGGAGGAAGSSAGGAAGSGGAPMGTGLGDWDPTPIGGTRPTKVYEPTSYAKGTPMPVVILLHGFSASGALQEAIFQLKPQAEARGFLYAHPDGTVGPDGKKFWNATDVCCDFGNTKVDDVAYLSGLVTEISSRWTVDPKRVYFIGHSNGGFMSFRMACDRADMIAGIVSLAGAMWSDTSLCKPSAPVSVLHIHGTADDMVAFDGVTNMGHATPSAAQTIGDWATYDGCSPTPTALPNRDVDSVLPGDETSVSDWTGCKAGTDAQLWTIAGGGHIPNITTKFGADIVDYLFAHPKE
jgi:polyhydroxybutyrate depolymerase